MMSTFNLPALGR